jgi:hypothetical protein
VQSKSCSEEVERFKNLRVEGDFVLSTVLLKENIELCHLVGIHAWCWDLDRALPVEVVVAKVIS